MKMLIKSEQQAQKEMIKKFYKDFFTWKADNIGIWIASGLLEVIYVGLMFIPFEEIMNEASVLAVLSFLGILGPYLYLLPYLVFTEERKQHRIYEKIKYLPVEKRLVQQIRVEKLFQFVIKIFPVIAVVQLGMSLCVTHHLTVWNFMYVLWFGLILPLLFNLPMAWLEK